MKSRHCRLRMGIMLGSLLLAPGASWGACSAEAHRDYEKGTQVSQKYTAQGQPCLEECLEEKRYFYQQAVELCLSFPEAHNNLGDVLEKLGRYPEAHTHYTKATELNPQLAVAYFGLGDLSFHTGEYAKAVEAYDKGLRIDPEDGLATTQRALALRLKEQQVPDAATIQAVLGGQEMKVMGPGGIKRGRRLPLWIPFAYDKDTLLPDAKRPLQELGMALKGILEDVPSAAFLVEGHTDLQGSDEYNLDLSTRRARRMVASLVADFALPSGRLRVKGFGKTRPISLGSTEADHMRNRRVEVVRLDGTETSAYQSGAPGSVPAVTESSALRVDVGVFYEDTESRPQKLDAGVKLRSGDGYRVFFESYQPCYVYIFQADASGKVFHLYPNPEYGTKENFVQARAANWAPGRDKWFVLDHTPGKEEIYVIASRERREDIEDLLTRLAQADHSGTQPKAKAQQELTVIIKSMGVSGVRAGKNTEVVATTGPAAALTTDQLEREGVSLAHKVAFLHE